MQIISNSVTTRGISEKAAYVILQSWRGSTQIQYSVYLKKWMVFCSLRGIDPYKATSVQAHFMTDLFEQGLGYSAMNQGGGREMEMNLNKLACFHTLMFRTLHR